MRRHGPRTAAWLQGEADALQGVREHGDEPYSRRLAELDDRLKRDAINPGTSADLTASALLVCRLVGIQVPATVTEYADPSVSCDLHPVHRRKADSQP